MRTKSRKPRGIAEPAAPAARPAVEVEQIAHNLNAIGCTRIVIAHRLTTIRDADMIVVMKAGRVVEQGVHGELMARDGVHAALTRQQEGGIRLECATPLECAERLVRSRAE
jgi:ABC-type sugar transport system ATPase subunit